MRTDPLYTVPRLGLIEPIARPRGFEYDQSDTGAEIRNLLMFGVLILIIIGVLLAVRKVRL